MVACEREREEEWKWVHTASQRVDKREIMQSWLKGKGKQVSSLLERQADSCTSIYATHSYKAICIPARYFFILVPC